METQPPTDSVAIFSTCPPSSKFPGSDYLPRVAEVARWSDECGCEGILVYTDNSLLDPWLVSAEIIKNTERLCPLVAIQPAYMHPYAMAKMITSLGSLYGRRIYLNMVAGGFRNDLAALGDHTPHDQRYQRLIEYTTIILHLLAADAPVSLEGDFYQVDKLTLTPPLARELQPGVFVSGSSEAGLGAARALGATAVRYPKPAEEEEPTPDGTALGIRVGIIARDDEESAWAVAHERFPEDRKGQLTHQMAMKVSDSSWHRELSGRDGAEEAEERSPYWLVPFKNYKTFCPYLVGTYDRVAAELARYFGTGFRKIILDIPPSREELEHTRRAIDLGAQRA